MSLITPLIVLLLIIVGSLAGFLAGLMGIGGGIILIPLFLWAFKVAGFSPDIIVHCAFGTSLAIIIPTAVSSALTHRERGNVDWNQVLRMVGGGVVGVAAGSTLAAGLSGDILKGLFGLMQMAVGLKMFLHHPHLPPELSEERPKWLLVLTGFVVGSFSSFFGVGGGVVAVPMMVILLQQPIHMAVGNSSALMVISAFAGTISYIVHGWGLPQLPPSSLGYVNLLVAAVTAPLTVVFARVGAKVASRISHDILLKTFAAFLILFGVQMAIRLLF